MTTSLRRRTLLAGLAGALAAACRPGGDAEMARSLADAARAVAPGQVLSLDQAVPIAWDRVMLVGPYTPPAAVRAAAGEDLPADVERSGIDRRDDINLLVFLRRGGDGLALELGRGLADFDRADLLRPVDRARARLVRGATGVLFRWQAA